MVAARHHEHVVIPGKRLGMRPRDPRRQLLRLGDYLTGRLPTHPPKVDYFARINQWCLGRNKEFGTCGPTSFANLTLLVSTFLGDAPIRPSDDDIIDLYRRSGNPDFDPETGAGDNGVDMTVMLSAAVKDGIGAGDQTGRITPLAFALINGRDPEEVWAASALFGGTLWGCDLTQAQSQQQVWNTVPGDAPWGGHAVLAAGRYDDQTGTRSDRTGLVSWADPSFDATDVFIQQQVSERYAVIFPWHLNSRTFIQGINLTTLAADYTDLTGRPFPSTTPTPVPTPPPPSPGPAPAADQILVRALDPWADTWPTTTKPKQAYRTWKNQRGYTQ